MKATNFKVNGPYEIVERPGRMGVYVTCMVGKRIFCQSNQDFESTDDMTVKTVWIECVVRHLLDFLESHGYSWDPEDPVLVANTWLPENREPRRRVTSL